MPTPQSTYIALLNRAGASPAAPPAHQTPYKFRGSCLGSHALRPAPDAAPRMVADGRTPYADHRAGRGESPDQEAVAEPAALTRHLKSLPAHRVLRIGCAAESVSCPTSSRRFRRARSVPCKIGGATSLRSRTGRLFISPVARFQFDGTSTFTKQ